MRGQQRTPGRRWRVLSASARFDQGTVSSSLCCRDCLCVFVPVLISASVLYGSQQSEAKTVSALDKSAQPKRLLSIGAKGSGEGQFTRGICSVAVAPDGNVWVGDETKVQIFSGDGKFVRQAAPAHLQHGHVYGIAFDTSNNEVYLTSSLTHCIVVCRLDGAAVRKMGSVGRGDGQLWSPMGIAVDAEKGLLFVSEIGNNRVQVVRRDGRFVRKWGVKGPGDGEFRYPGALALANGQLFVADLDNHRIQVSSIVFCFILCADPTLCGRCSTLRKARFFANLVAKAKHTDSSAVPKASPTPLAAFSCAIKQIIAFSC